MLEVDCNALLLILLDDENAINLLKEYYADMVIITDDEKYVDKLTYLFNWYENDRPVMKHKLYMLKAKSLSNID